MNVGNCSTIERLASVINSCRHRALRSGTQRVRSASLFTGSCACMPELASPLASVNRSGRDAGVGEGASCWSLTSAVGEEYRGPDRVHLARRALQPGIASSCVQVCVVVVVVAVGGWGSLVTAAGMGERTRCEET